MPNDSALRQQLVDLLTKENAHAGFDAAVKGLPAGLRGRRPKGGDHSPWEILEHLRTAQADILDFSVNPKYKAMVWPDDYWPKTKAPATDEAWTRSVRAFRKDLKKMCALVADESTDLYAKIPHGEGQTILREALLIADHNAYHIGQLVLTRKLLGSWK